MLSCINVMPSCLSSLHKTSRRVAARTGSTLLIIAWQHSVPSVILLKGQQERCKIHRSSSCSGVCPSGSCDLIFCRWNRSANCTVHTTTCTVTNSSPGLCIHTFYMDTECVTVLYGLNLRMKFISSPYFKQMLTRCPSCKLLLQIFCGPLRFQVD